MFAVPMTDFMAGDTKKPMLVLLGAVGFVLLIACSNIAGLMVAQDRGPRQRDSRSRGAGRGAMAACPAGNCGEPAVGVGGAMLA